MHSNRIVAIYYFAFYTCLEKFRAKKNGILFHYTMQLSTYERRNIEFLLIQKPAIHCTAKQTKNRCATNFFAIQNLRSSLFIHPFHRNVFFMKFSFNRDNLLVYLKYNETIYLHKKSIRMNFQLS